MPNKGYAFGKPTLHVYRLEWHVREPQQSASAVPNFPLEVDLDQSRKGTIVYVAPDDPDAPNPELEFREVYLGRLRGADITNPSAARGIEESEGPTRDLF